MCELVKSGKVPSIDFSAPNRSAAHAFIRSRAADRILALEPRARTKSSTPCAVAIGFVAYSPIAADSFTGRIKSVNDPRAQERPPRESPFAGDKRRLANFAIVESHSDDRRKRKASTPAATRARSGSASAQPQRPESPRSRRIKHLERRNAAARPTSN
jgi:aryl-alcohol dehydrogenase-like predicted oxidoreductase